MFLANIVPIICYSESCLQPCRKHLDIHGNIFCFCTHEGMFAGRLRLPVDIQFGFMQTNLISVDLLLVNDHTSTTYKHSSPEVFSEYFRQTLFCIFEWDTLICCWDLPCSWCTPELSSHYKHILIVRRYLPYSIWYILKLFM